MVYTGKIGGKTTRIVSVATMEGMWFAYDAKTGAPIYQRVKVLDNVEHPALVPGKPVAVYPSSLGGFNYSPASYDPADELRLQRGRRDRHRSLQQQTPAQEQIQQLLLGNTFLGLANGDFGQYLQSRLEGLRLRQRDRREHRQGRLEVQHAAARARRRDHDGVRASASSGAATAF